MLTTLLIAASMTPAAQALDRFQSFVSRSPAISVSFKLSGVGGFSATGRFLMEKPERVLFTVSGAGLDYSFSSTEKGIVEIERSKRRYDEFPPQGKFVAPRSRISAAAGVGFPSVFVFGNLRSIWPDEATITFKGSEPLRGVKVDHVIATYAVARGEGRSDVYIDEAGRLLQLVLKTEIQGQTSSFTHEYLDYQTGPLGLAAFLTPIPLGFVPHTLPATSTYLNDGQPLLKTRLSDSAGRVVELKFEGKGALLAMTGPDCGPSARAQAMMRRLRDKAESLGWGYEEISTAVSAASAKTWTGASRVLFDPAGDTWDMLGAQGTPSLLLVDAKGRRLRYWYGFDPAQPKALEVEVGEAMEGKKPEQD